MNKRLKILVVGVGGLGCPASIALADLGAAELGLMDPDRVEASNLHRQILYSNHDIGQPKVEAASKTLLARFPQLKVVPIQEAFSPSNAESILGRYDLVIDGLDRLEKKFLLNDWCVKLGKPFVHAGVVKFEGQVMAVKPGQTACLRCLIPKIPPPFAMPTCQEAGVLGSFSQAIGYLQAVEAIKLAAGDLPLRLWKLDVQKREIRTVVHRRNPDCLVCVRGKKTEEIDANICSS